MLACILFVFGNYSTRSKRGRRKDTATLEKTRLNFIKSQPKKVVVVDVVVVVVVAIVFGVVVVIRWGG